MQPGRGPEDTAKGRVSTPRGELSKLRQEQARIESEAAIRNAIMDSVLEACGEIGYRRVTVDTICRRYGGSRTHFYSHFASKADCFSAAYDREGEILAKKLLSAEEERYDDRLRGALDELAAFVTEQPLRARAVFVEVHVAGGDVLGKRKEVFERLSLALDKAGRETKSRHSVPPLAGELMINVIDQAVSRALIEDEVEEFARVVPDLTALVCQTYSGR